MNDAHLHLIINHFPIIGTIIGTIILLVGVLKKNKTIQQTALTVLVFAAIIALPTMKTGEGAEEIVEQLGTSHNIIHEHEELAEKFIWLSNIMGVFALVALYLHFKNNKKAYLLAIITLVLAISCAIFGKFVGTSGGEIRHTEIRSNFDTNTIENQNEFTKEED